MATGLTSVALYRGGAKMTGGSALLIGQAGLRRALARSVDDKVVSHATLFTGLAGSGKRTWARFLARALLCSAPVRGEPCESCLSCRRFHSGNHSLYWEMEPEGRFLKVEQIRESRSRFYLSGAGTGTRLCLIAGAELLTAEAGNSLLKVLEEPPKGLYFLLTSSHPGRVLPTIMSRCRCYHVAPLAGSEIEQILGEAGSGPKTDRLNLIVSLCSGLPGKALALAGDADLQERLDSATGLAALCSEATGDGMKLLEAASTLAGRSDWFFILELLCLVFRDRLIWSLSHDPNLLIYPGYQQELPELPPGCLQDSLDILIRTMQELDTTSANRRLALESLLIMLKRRADRCRK